MADATQETFTDVQPVQPVQKQQPETFTDVAPIAASAKPVKPTTAVAPPVTKPAPQASTTEQGDLATINKGIQGVKNYGGGLLNSVGLPENSDEYKAGVKEATAKITPGKVAKVVTGAGPVIDLGMQAYGAGKNYLKGLWNTGKEAYEAGQNIAQGQPVMPNLAKPASAYLEANVGAIPFVGAPVLQGGKDFSAGNYAHGAGELTGAIAQLGFPKAVDKALPEQDMDFHNKAVETAQKKLDTAKKASEPYRDSLEKGVQPPKKIQGPIDKAQAELDEAIFHRDTHKDAINARRTNVVNPPAAKPAPEVPTSQVEAMPRPGAPSPADVAGLKHLGYQDAEISKMTQAQARDINTKQTTPPRSSTPQNIKLPGQVQPETFPQQPTEKPQVPSGPRQLPGGEPMGRMLQLGEGRPEGPQIPAGGLPKIGEVPAEAPKPAAKFEPGNVKTLKPVEGKVVDKETVPGSPEHLQKLIQEGLKPETKAVTPAAAEKPVQAAPAEVPKVEAKAAPVLPKEEVGYTPKKEEVIKTGEEGREQAKSAAEYHPAVQAEVGNLSNSNLDKLATAHGIDPTAPEYSRSKEMRSKATDTSSGRHQIGRDKLAADITEQMSDDEKTNIGRNAERLNTEGTFQNKDMTGKSKAERAESLFPRLRGPVDEAGNPKISGGSQGADIEAQAKAHNENGGSTFHPEKGDLSGTEHFAVGGEPEFRDPKLKMTTDGKSMTAEQVKEFSERPEVKTALDKHKDASVGTWYDKDTDKTTTELVKTPTDRDQAIAMGQKNGEKAIYDLGKGEEIKTERRSTERKAPLNAKETEVAMQNRKPYQNPFDVTEGAKATIESDKNMPKHPAEEAKASGKADNYQGEPMSYEQTQDQHHIVTKDGSGKKIGELVAKDSAPGTVEVLSNQIYDKNLQGKGRGADQIQHLLNNVGDDTHTVKSDISTTDQARAAWDKVQKFAPDAITREEFKDGQVQYTADMDKWRGENLPTVSGGSPAAGTATAKEGKFDPLSEEHLTPEEKAGLSKSAVARRNYADNMAKLPPLQEWVDAAKGGEGAKDWYMRSRQAFKALRDAMPNQFKPEDGERWANFVASLSPRQMVHKNLAEAIHAWSQWTADGRPMDDAGMEKSLRDAIASTPDTKVPNAMKALQGKEMWPDLTKNRNFKVPSFGKNLSPAENAEVLKKYMNFTTNDGWQALFGGLDEKKISSPSSYHPLSVMTRAAAKELGWEPEQAQAAIWSFTQALKERGEVDPQYVREYSGDFADILAENAEIRNQLKELGVDLGQLDEKLKAVGHKPEVTPGASASTEHSTGQLASRIEAARGKGAIPEPKQQTNFSFREPQANEGRTRIKDEGTEFNPEEFGNEEPLIKPGEKKKPGIRKM